MEWVRLSERMPTKEECGKKVLLCRLSESTGDGFYMSVHDVAMVKHCDINETWWVKIPPFSPPVKYGETYEPIGW